MGIRDLRGAITTGFSSWVGERVRMKAWSGWGDLNALVLRRVGAEIASVLDLVWGVDVDG